MNNSSLGVADVNRTQTPQPEETKGIAQNLNARNAQLSAAKANDMRSLFDTNWNQDTQSNDASFEKKSIDFKNVKAPMIPGISKEKDLVNMMKNSNKSTAEQLGFGKGKQLADILQNKDNKNDVPGNLKMRSDLSMSSDAHPYLNSQKLKYANNEYLTEIPNWENIKTFILPNEFVKRKFDVIQDYIEKEFKERGMRNIFYENQYEYSKIHKCRRYQECLCRVFVRDLLQLAYYKKVENVHKYLERYIYLSLKFFSHSTN